MLERNINPAALTVSVADACSMLGLCRETLYELIRKRQVHALKSGRRTLISMASLRSYVAGLPPAEIKPRVRRKRRASDTGDSPEVA